MDTSKIPFYSVEDDISFYFRRIGTYAYKLLNRKEEIIYQITRLLDEKGVNLSSKRTRLTALSTRYTEIASFEELKELVNVNSNFSRLPKCCQILILSKYIDLASSLEELTGKYLIKYQVTRAGDATTTKAYKEKIELLEIKKLVQENSLHEVKKLATTPAISDLYIIVANDYWDQLSLRYVCNCTDRQQALVIYPDLHEKVKKLALRYWKDDKIIDKKDVKTLKDQDVGLNTSITPGFTTGINEKETKEIVKKITSIKDIQNLYKKSLKKTKRSELILERWKELFNQYLQEYNSLEQIVSLAGRIPPKFDEYLYFEKLESIVTQEVQAVVTLEDISRIMLALGKTYPVATLTHPYVFKKFKELLLTTSLEELKVIIPICDMYYYIYSDSYYDCYHIVEKMINQSESIIDLCSLKESRDYRINSTIKTRIDFLRDNQTLL